MTKPTIFELRKVKGAVQTYKVLQDGKRPIISVPCAIFINPSTVKLDASSLTSLINIETALIDHISNDYTAISSITVQHNNKSKKHTVVNVDSSAVHIGNGIGNVFTLQLKCRSVRYVENIALISWCVDEATEVFPPSLTFYDEDEEDANDDDEDDDIEPPVDELLSLRMEALQKLDVLMDIRKKLVSCSISDIAINLKLMNDIV